MAAKIEQSEPRLARVGIDVNILDFADVVTGRIPDGTASRILEPGGREVDVLDNALTIFVALLELAEQLKDRWNTRRGNLVNSVQLRHTSGPPLLFSLSHA